MKSNADPTNKDAITASSPAKEDLASAVIKISEAMKALTASGINRRGIVVLIRDGTHLSKRTVEQVLDSLENLKREYTV